MREWISSMKMMTSRLAASSEMIPLSRSSNWPRYLVPATMRERSRARIRLFTREGGTSPSWMRTARPSTMAVFPTPGSPMSTGLFFRRRESTWTILSSSASRPMRGSKARLAVREE